jgi:hypothetical protein
LLETRLEITLDTKTNAGRNSQRELRINKEQNKINQESAFRVAWYQHQVGIENLGICTKDCLE